MNLDDEGKSMVDMRCYCGSKHCSGELLIYHDTIGKDRVLMITTVDTKGDDEGTMWINREQLGDLIDQLNAMKYELDSMEHK